MAGTKITAFGSLSAFSDTSLIPTVDSLTNYKMTGSVLATYTTSKIPTASSSVLGLVKVDNSTITLNGSNQIAVANALTIGTGLSGTSYNGSSAVTITNSGVTAITTSSGLSTNTSATGAVSITNTGVTSAVAGTGISVSSGTGAVTFTNSGVTSIVAGTGISISGATGAVTITAGGSPSFTNVTVTGQIIEPFNTYSTAISASPVITFNCATGNVWRVTSTASSAWTSAFTNVAVTTGQATNITMIITQGATPYIPSAITINGNSATVTWQGGLTPTGNASKQDAIAYSIMQTGASTYVVYGQLVSFG